ncbi:MAG: TIR domain-containing protein [Aureispira sp.]
MQHRLQIYVVWQPENREEAEHSPGFFYAQEIFSAFNRKIDEPLNRGIGIPTYFISNAGILSQIVDWDAAEKTIVVWLVSDAMILEEREEWKRDVQEVLNHKDQSCLIPVALTKYIGKFYSAINSLNRIELYPCKEEEKLPFLLEKLAFKLAQELCDTNEGERLPLTLFLSHARKDGKDMAKEIHHVIQELSMNLGSFLDVRNIEAGAEFDEVITTHIEKSIFLIINTNVYNEREWCLKELLLAKKKNRPIVVVNAQREVTRRTWPYLGNTPVVYLPINTSKTKGLKGEKEATTTTSIDDGDRQFRKIIYYVLIESVRYVYQQKLLETKVGTATGKIFSTAPELLTMYQQKVEANQLVVYPDPPLGNTEAKLLKDVFNVPMITSTLYPLAILESPEESSATQEFIYEKNLDDFIIGVSVSEIPLVKSGVYEGIGIWHLQDALVELTRYLFVCGATCAYGGDIKHQVKISNLNFTTTLLELLQAYNYNYSAQSKIINHVAALYAEDVKADSELQVSADGLIQFIYHKDQVRYHPNGKRPLARKEYTLAQRAICFTDMRRTMFAKHNEAQIFMGGKVVSSESIIPGVLEEVYWALKFNRPIYIIGAFGGVSGALAELFLTGSSDVLRTGLREKQENATWKATYKEYLQIPTGWEETEREIHERIHYEQLKLFLLRYRSKQQDKYLWNGLNKKENEILFTSKNILEISGLVLKGLHRHFKLKK